MHSSHSGPVSVVFSLMLLGLASPGQAQDAEFYALGDLPGGEFKSSALAVSNDGQKVAGRGTGGNVDTLTGFLWSPESGMVPLGDTSDGETAYQINNGSMSPDGQFLVGRIREVQGGRSVAFRWTAAGGFLELQSPAEYTRNMAWGVSDDGSVVTGYITTDDFEKTHAFRWTQQSGLTDLGLLNVGDAYSYGYGISGDGRVIVGESHPTSEGGEAFRWTESEGMVGLGFLEGGAFSRANDASKDGSVIVGLSWSKDLSGNAVTETFRWIEGQGMAGLGVYPPNITGSWANAVSAGGQVIVGVWKVSNPETVGHDQQAMVWTEATGPLELRETLINGGATGLENWILESAEDVSDNGQWVVGQGINPEGNEEAFLARLGSEVVPRLQINAGFNDAWYNAEKQGGQGVFVVVFPDIGSIFLAWFTYDTMLPDGSIDYVIGHPSQRWYTAFGPYNGDTAELNLELNSGGLFDSAVAINQVNDGTVTLKAISCTEMLFSYDITSAGVSGDIPLSRIANDNVERCEELSNGAVAQANKKPDPVPAASEQKPSALPATALSAGFSDAWLNPEKQGGQGIFAVVFPLIQKIFMAWFTYDTEQPAEDIDYTIGHPSQRWYTAFGPYEGDTAVLNLELNSNGIFDSATPIEQVIDGEVTLKSIDCEEMLLTYDIFSADLQGEIPLKRIANDNVDYCESPEAQ